ncbi:MAG: hypothetical protein HZC51_05475 [Nitrospirae bacterium]|nr:hypothetical protein [Nitrospirota bacterium]
MTHTGGSPMMDPNIRALSDAVQQGREECAQLCAPRANQDNTGGGNGQGGYGQPRGAPRGPDPDNPFEDTGGRASANDPDDPFADIVDDDKGGGDTRARSGGSSVGSPGGGNDKGGGASASSQAGSNMDGKGTKAEGDDDKPLKFNTRSCGYFTKPPEKDRLNSYAKGSKVCYGKFMYECTEDRGWVSIGQCSDYDKFFVKHAEDLEKSRFNTNILLDY